MRSRGSDEGAVAMTRKEWTVSTFVDWFDGYVVTDDARSKARRVARRYCCAELADEVYSQWYESIRRTMANKESRREPAGTFSSEDDARAYTYRVLVNTAIDLVRVKPHEPLSGTDLPGPSLVEDTLPMIIDETRCRLYALLDSLPSGRHGCRADRCVPLALAFLELSLGTRTVAEWHPNTGGNDEVEGLFWEAFQSLWPSLPQSDPPVRKMRSRCTKCAISLLSEVILESGYDDGEADDA